MLIAYCETCGFRIPESDLTSGAARKEDEHRYFCAKCAAAASTPVRKPPTKSIVRPNFEARPTPTHETLPGTTGRPVTGPVRLPAASGSGSAPAPVPPARTDAAAPKAPPVKKQDSTLLLVGGGAGEVGLLLIVLFMGG